MPPGTSGVKIAPKEADVKTHDPKLAAPALPTSATDRPPKVEIIIQQGSNQKGRGSLRVEGPGTYIIKTKVYHDKMRYIVASQEKRFYREVDVKITEAKGPLRTTKVLLEDNKEQVEEFVGEKLIRRIVNGQVQRDSK